MNINLKLCLLGTITLAAILVSPSAACAGDEVVFSETFDGKLADGWTWLREDADAWRIKDGGLEIRVQPGVAHNVKNALLRDAPDRSKGKYAVEVTVTNHTEPTQQFEQAGITWYHDGKPVVKLVKELINGELFIIPGRKPMDARTVTLRLVVTADTWTAQYRPAGSDEFQTAATGKLPAPGKDQVSVQCYNGPPEAEHWIRFDDFRILGLSDVRASDTPGSLVQAGFYTPPHRVGRMWDTWVVWHEGVYYMYYIAGAHVRWDAHEIAVSPDGVHWTYHGVAVKPRPETTWIGTGHVWKSPAFDQNGLWILNYSECVGVGDGAQDIMFATSPDLLHWTKVDESLRFVQDTRWYKPKNGRWDCIDVLDGGDGWLYGYFTANPDPAKVDYPHCGFGFARSRDGLRWEAQAPVPGDMAGEFGGIQKIGDRYYITMSEGRVGVGNGPKGPFVGQKKNHNVFGGTIYFPRFCHTAPDGPLMNHFYLECPVYAAPLKAVHVDDEGILRLVWWSGNEKLKAAELPAGIGPAQGPVRWLEDQIDANQTTVIEGTVSVPEPGQPGPALRGLLIDQGNDTAQCLSFEQTQTLFGQVQLDSQPIKWSQLDQKNPRHCANRDLDYGREQAFRILLNHNMMEVYVNDYLATQTRVRNPGRLGLLIGDDPDSIRNVRIWRSANESEAPMPPVTK